MSQRRLALTLGANPKTVARKLVFLAKQKRNEHEVYLKELEKAPLKQFQFDEMETHEHSKWKPLSIPLAVSADRKILGFSVSSMPARGKDAAKARAKYGYRPDERRSDLQALLKGLKPVIHPEAEIHSDQKTLYPSLVRENFPQSKHCRFKGIRGCVAGQGELKKVAYDPLFSLNHTAAMFRANINRLFRKTWCTTKKREHLSAHVWLYVAFHNQVLTT